MNLNYLDAQTFHSAILNACTFIINHRQDLNAINLFPVADGDTGDNMAATALAVINHSAPQASLKETIQSLANSALLGARGNSGMIFSQFFNGLTETPLKSEHIDIATFVQLIAQASISVRLGILHPVEGTIITVIDAWSASITKLAPHCACFKELIPQSLNDVYQALQSTTNTLNVLKEAGVVDAGALGFYHFIQGFNDYLLNPRLISNKVVVLECTDSHHEVPAADAPPKQRYCTEITLEGERIDKINIGKQLEQFGDSIVSSGNAQMCRFHLHCLQPAAVFESLIDVGKISQTKADDMLRQYQMIHQRKHPIALVTDSSADIPQALLEEHQIHIIQLNMHLDEHNLLDRICINPETFYEHLVTLKTYPKTSFPSPAIIKGQISQLARHYEQVLIVPIAQALSGTHDAIVKATSNFSNVHVINSCHTSASLGLIVSYAAQLIDQGLPIDEIKKQLLLKIPKVNLFIYVASFESMIRSGRISKFGGRIADFANVKPIMSVDKTGKGFLCDKAFSELKALRKLVHRIENLCVHQTLETYGLVHAGVPEKAHKFAQLTSEAFGQSPAFIESVSTAVGLHAGRGSIAIASMMN